MKKHLNQLFFALCSLSLTPSVAQPLCNNFDCKMQLARKALNATPPQYKTALDLARGAESYDPKRKTEVNAFIDEVFNAIEKKRKEAETQRQAAETQKKLAIAATKKAQDAETKALAEQAKTVKALEEVKAAQKQAEENLQKAQEAEAKALAQEAEARASKADTKKALDKLKVTANEAVSILLAEIDRNILRLEYDSTFKKCQTAVNLDAQQEEVKKRILEIAYFYTEADTAEGAVKVLKLLNINALSNRKDLLVVIEKNITPPYFAFLIDRYYPKMIDVQGGLFEMNDSMHITLSDFNIAQTETTFWQYNLFAKATKHPIQNPSWQFSGDNPAVYTSWYDAVEYANWLSQKKGGKQVYKIDGNQEGDKESTVKTDWQAKGYRLPTEAEWAFAARGGNKTQGFQYSGSNNIDSVAWFDDNSKNRTQTVGTKKVNELGLYDMSGNVWEWCFDWYGEYDKSDTNNPHDAVKGDYRVNRGGSWLSYAGNCRPSDRFNDSPSYRSYDLGFRIVFFP